MLKDKVIVVTGAGGGIGRDFAHAMAAKGAKVVVNDVGASVSGEGKDVGPAQRVVDEIKAQRVEHGVLGGVRLHRVGKGPRLEFCVVDHVGSQLKTSCERSSL